MKKRYDLPAEEAELRDKIVGLGAKSVRKSYYPVLREKLEDLERYKTLLDQSNDAIFLIKVPSGQFLDVSKSACRQICCSEEECSSLTMFDLLPGNREELNSILSGRAESLVLDTLLLKCNREETPYEVNMRKVQFGSADFVVAVARDISERKRAEEELRESEEKFRALAESSPAAIVVYQGEWLVSVNPAAELITGYSKAELLQMRTIDLIHPDFKELVRERARRRQRGEPEPSQYETKIITRDGEIRWVMLSVGLMVYRGKPAGVVTMLDITERKQAEEALRTSEMQLNAVIQGSPIPQFVIGRDHRIIKWNKALEESSGIRAGDVMHTDLQCTAFYKEKRPCLADLLVDGAIDKISLWYAGKFAKSKLVEDAYEVTDFFPKMGESGKWLFFTASAIKDSRGDVIGAVETLEDITERKQAEEALRESEWRFRQLADCSPMPIALYDINENINYLNTKFISTFGYTHDDIPTLNSWWPLAYPDPVYRQEIIEKWMSYVDKVISGLKGVAPMEAMVTCKDRSTRCIEFYCSVIGNQRMVMLQDITERKQAENELLDAKAQAELYLDLMSHDITNMNQAMMGYLELMEATWESGVLDKGLMDSLIEIINRSSRLISDVKKLTHVQAGKVPLKDVDLCEILAAVKARYSMMPGRLVTINYSPLRECLVRACDTLRDVFDNLVDNAIRHSTGPITIDIAVDRVILEGRWYYRITVADTGPGIPDDLKKKIFLTIKEIEEKPERRGFGLYLVRTVIDYHHGKVWVEDRVPGDYTRGAKFVVMMPAAEK